MHRQNHRSLQEFTSDHGMSIVSHVSMSPDMPSASVLAGRQSASTATCRREPATSHLASLPQRSFWTKEKFPAGTKGPSSSKRAGIRV